MSATATPLVCPRCGRKEGAPNHRGNPIRFNRKRGLCYGCAHSLLKNPDATPWYDPSPAPKTCGRCGRTEGEKTQQGQPLTFPGTHSKYTNYCHPCIGALRTGRTLQHRPNPKERCKVCGRRHTKANPIGGPGSKYPGFCRACRITVDRRSRTYPVRPCTECGHTHNTRGRLLAALRAAHMTIYQTPIEFEWESHPHLTEEEAEQVPHIIDTLQAEHKTRANLLTTTRTPHIYEEQ